MCIYHILYIVRAIARYLIRAPEEHRIKWLPRPPVPIEKRIAAGEEVLRPSLFLLDEDVGG